MTDTQKPGSAGEQFWSNSVAQAIHRARRSGAIVQRPGLDGWTTSWPPAAYQMDPRCPGSKTTHSPLDQLTITPTSQHPIAPARGETWGRSPPYVVSQKLVLRLLG